MQSCPGSNEVYQILRAHPSVSSIQRQGGIVPYSTLSQVASERELPANCYEQAYPANQTGLRKQQKSYPANQC